MEIDLKALRSLCLVVVIDVLGFGILIPLIPYMAAQFGAPPELNTAVLGTYSLCQLLAAPLWGRLSDRFGRRPILLSSMCGAFASYIILAFAHTLTVLFVARALAGFMAGNLSAAMAYASDISTARDRAKTMGMVGASIGIGFMLGPAIGGALAGEQVRNVDFMRPALLAASLSCVAMALVLFMLPESHGRQQRLKLLAMAAATRERGWRLLRSLPGLRLLALATLLVTFSQSTLESIFAIWAMDRYHVGPLTVGMTLFVLAIVAVGVQGGLMRKLVPRYGEHRLALTGILCYVLGLATVAYGGALSLVIVGLVFCGLGAGLFSPSGAALASHQAQTHNRGAVMGVYQSGTSTARVLAPFVAGPMYMRFGAASPYLLACVVTLQALWCILAARRLHAAQSSHAGV
ncbi:MAG TPA: MFS transporter [Steroidobacteraceae bacterium]|nr:MFS transporter [Steroidobacteraceae bacterium]